MPKEKGKGLCCHFGFDSAARECFGKIDQVVYRLLIGDQRRLGVWIVAEEIAKLQEIISGGVWAVMSRG